MPEKTFLTLWHPRSGVRCHVKFIPGETHSDGACNVRVDYSFRHTRGLPADMDVLSAQVEDWTKRCLTLLDFDLPDGWRRR